MPKRDCRDGGIKRENGGLPNGLPSTPKRQALMPPPQRQGPPFGLLDKPKAKTLMEIRNLMESKSKPGMPGLVSPEVYDSLCMEAVSQWWAPLQTLVHDTKQKLADELRGTLFTAFGNLRKRRAYKDADSFVEEFVNMQAKHVGDALQKLYKIETNKCYTIDKESFGAPQDGRGQSYQPPPPYHALQELRERQKEERRRMHRLPSRNGASFQTRSVFSRIRGWPRKPRRWARIRSKRSLTSAGLLEATTSRQLPDLPTTSLCTSSRALSRPSWKRSRAGFLIASSESTAR